MSKYEKVFNLNIPVVNQTTGNVLNYIMKNISVKRNMYISTVTVNNLSWFVGDSTAQQINYTFSPDDNNVAITKVEYTLSDNLKDYLTYNSESHTSTGGHVIYNVVKNPTVDRLTGSLTVKVTDVNGKTHSGVNQINLWKELALTVEFTGNDNNITCDGVRAAQTFNATTLGQIEHSNDTFSINVGEYAGFTLKSITSSNDNFSIGTLTATGCTCTWTGSGTDTTAVFTIVLNNTDTNRDLTFTISGVKIHKNIYINSVTTGGEINHFIDNNGTDLTITYSTAPTDANVTESSARVIFNDDSYLTLKSHSAGTFVYTIDTSFTSNALEKTYQVEVTDAKGKTYMSTTNNITVIPRLGTNIQIAADNNVIIPNLNRNNDASAYTVEYVGEGEFTITVGGIVQSVWKISYRAENSSGITLISDNGAGVFRVKANSGSTKFTLGFIVTYRKFDEIVDPPIYTISNINLKKNVYIDSITAESESLTLEYYYKNSVYPTFNFTINPSDYNITPTKVICTTDNSVINNIFLRTCSYSGDDGTVTFQPNSSSQIISYDIKLTGTATVELTDEKGNKKTCSSSITLYKSPCLSYVKIAGTQLSPTSGELSPDNSINANGQSLHFANNSFTIELQKTYDYFSFSRVEFSNSSDKFTVSITDNVATVTCTDDYSISTGNIKIWLKNNDNNNEIGYAINNLTIVRDIYIQSISFNSTELDKAGTFEIPVTFTPANYTVDIANINATLTGLDDYATLKSFTKDKIVIEVQTAVSDNIQTGTLKLDISDVKGNAFTKSGSVSLTNNATKIAIKGFDINTSIDGQSSLTLPNFTITKDIPYKFELEFYPKNSTSEFRTQSSEYSDDNVRISVSTSDDFKKLILNFNDIEEDEDTYESGDYSSEIKLGYFFKNGNHSLTKKFNLNYNVHMIGDDVAYITIEPISLGGYDNVVDYVSLARPYSDISVDLKYYSHSTLFVRSLMYIYNEDNVVDNFSFSNLAEGKAYNSYKNNTQNNFTRIMPNGNPTFSYVTYGDNPGIITVYDTSKLYHLRIGSPDDYTYWIMDRRNDGTEYTSFTAAAFKLESTYCRIGKITYNNFRFSEDCYLYIKANISGIVEFNNCIFDGGGVEFNMHNTFSESDTGSLEVNYNNCIFNGIPSEYYKPIYKDFSNIESINYNYYIVNVGDDAIEQMTEDTKSPLPSGSKVSFDMMTNNNAIAVLKKTFGNDATYEEIDPNSKTPFWVKCTSSRGDLKINLSKWDSYSDNVDSLYWSSDLKTWNKVEYSTSDIIIKSVAINEIVYFKANWNLIKSYTDSTSFDGQIYVSSLAMQIGGNIASMFGNTIQTNYYVPMRCIVSNVNNASQLYIPSGWNATLMFGNVSSTVEADYSFVIRDNVKCYKMFYNNKSIKTKVPDMSNFTSIGSSQCNSMFNGCTSLITPPDMSNVTTIDYYGCNYMFYGCTSLITPPDMSNVTTIGNYGCNLMFYGCTSLTTAANLSNLLSITLSSCEGMYLNCTKLTSCPDFTNLKTINSQGSMRSMFYGCTSLVKMPFLGNITTIETGSPYGKMFYGCTSLIEADLSYITINCSWGSNFSEMFYGCTSLTTAKLPKLDIAPGRNDSGCWMFYGCTALKNIYLYSYTSTKISDADSVIDKNGNITSSTTGYKIGSYLTFEGVENSSDVTLYIMPNSSRIWPLAIKDNAVCIKPNWTVYIVEN